MEERTEKEKKNGRSRGRLDEDEGVREAQEEVGEDRDVDDGMKMHWGRGGGGGGCDGVGGGGWSDDRSGGKGGFVLHPAGTWSSLAPEAPSSQSPSFNQEEQSMNVIKTTASQRQHERGGAGWGGGV